MTTFIEIQGENLAIEIYEPMVRIADVVLVHGFTGSKEDFNEIGPLLADEGYRVLTFDNRGQHESAHSKRDDGYSMPSLARDVIEIAHHYGFEQPHLLGHSFGGLVSQRAAVDAPHYWKSLTLFCTGPHWIPDKPDLDATIHILETMTMEDSWNKYKEETDKLLPRYEIYKKRWKASDPKSTKTMAHHLKDTQALTQEIIATKIPVHVVYGENDDAWPLEMQDQMAKDLSAPRTIIKDAGHCPNEDQPEETVKVLTNFWSGL
ncbi:MhpC Predicted hydrolases or acyltransferases (alpha/beta hydrolase superfamily) [Candidatus Nanopelagicaceae bacterium]